MAIFKLTTLFSTATAVSTPSFTGRRAGGFSESWYYTGNSSQDVIIAAINGTVPGVQGLWSARAGLMGKGAGIVGYRVQQVSPPGPGQSNLINYPGLANYAQDVPQMALLVKIPAFGANNIRRVKLKGVPDIQVTEGELQADSVFTTALQTFFSSLVGWQFRGRDLTQTVNKIVSISAAGVVTFEQNVTYTTLQFLRILRTQDTGKILRGGRFQVLSLGTAGNLLTIGPWPFGATVGGSARLDAVVYPTVNVTLIGQPKVVVAKVGNPFFRYRGRRSKRR